MASASNTVPVGSYFPDRDQPQSTAEELSVINRFHDIYYTRWVSGQSDSINIGWFGYHMLKCPLDVWLYQELIVRTRPSVIVETGTFEGGSALFMAMLFDRLGAGRVISIDIEDKPHRPQHPRIRYVSGSSTDPAVIAEVYKDVGGEPAMVILDSDHKAEHVFDEIMAYKALVRPGFYLIVEDTNVNGHPTFPQYGPGPMEALNRFLVGNSEFEVDERCHRFMMTLNPRGYLKRRVPQLASPIGPAPDATEELSDTQSSPERESFLNFIRLNSSLWTAEDAVATQSTSDRIVFVDLLSHDQQIYAMRALYIAKTLQKRYGFKLVGVVGTLVFSRELLFDYRKADAIKLAHSFGITDFIDLETAEPSPGTAVAGLLTPADVAAALQAIRVCPDEGLADLILGLRAADGCRIGEYIYETVIRVTRDPFVTNTRAKLEDVLREAYRLHNVIVETCHDRLVEAFVTGHLSYTQWGMAADLILRRGGKALWFDCEGNFSAYLLTRPPQGEETLDGLIRQIETDLFEREYQARDMLDPRAVGKIQHLFSSNYFARPFWFEAAKKPPAALAPVLRKMALQRLGWPDDGRPVICIFFHCFSDLPRDDEQVYLDYYVWVVETLKIAIDDTSKKWIFKTHPWNRGVYDVTNVTDKLKEDYKGYEHIVFLEDELEKMQVFAICDLAVTVRGSIAYEMSVFGKPALVAGRSLRSDLGFCRVARDAEEYKAMLTEKSDTLTLTDEMQDRANFYIFYDKIICRVESTFLPFWTYELTGSSNLWDAMSDRVLYNISDLDPAVGAIGTMYGGGPQRIVNPALRAIMEAAPGRHAATPLTRALASRATELPSGGILSFGFEGNGGPALLSKATRWDDRGSWFAAERDAFVGFVLGDPRGGAEDMPAHLQVRVSHAPPGSYLHVTVNGSPVQRVSVRTEGTGIDLGALGLRPTRQDNALAMRLWLADAAGARSEFRLDSIAAMTPDPSAPQPANGVLLNRLLRRGP